jgi:hypothetical protein
MSQPKVFVGSSQKSLRVARIIADGLEECADVSIWSERVFGLNEGFLDTLLKSLKEYDFAIFVLAADDMTISKDETRMSPRDNVLFESGLFMGVLGRERVFLVYDDAAQVKIPSDLAGISLASYDGSKIDGANPEAATRKACMLITDRIKAPKFAHLVGEWKSKYPITFEEGHPVVEEDVEIRPSRDGISITSLNNPQDDYYVAFGRVRQDRQILGEWKSREEHSDTCGIFALTVDPSSGYMYGYFTSHDENGGLTFATWVLAKKAGADEAKVTRRLTKAQNVLTQTTIGLSLQGPGSEGNA